MNAKEANQISICSYLSSIGIEPARIVKGYYFYHSPYRIENTPSFKVCNNKNLWVDYGDSNAGGTLIDLVLKLNPNYGVADAIKEIAKFDGQSIPFHQSIIKNFNSTRDDEDRRVKVHYTKELGNNLALTSYLQSRGIGLDTARRFCKEVYYSIDDKKYFGIGNEHSNGWNIRNKYWKGCSGQGYSHYGNNGSKLCLFEGIFDLLSYVELQKEKNAKEDYLVLNSLANLKKALPVIKKYNRVDLYLDRDGAGMKTANELIKRYSQCSDLSKIIYPHKDFNEYLIGSGSRRNLR